MASAGQDTGARRGARRGAHRGAHRRDIGRQAALLALLCVIAGAWSVTRGTDANWDLRNCHLYTARAWA